MRLDLITRCKNEPYVNEFVNHYLNEGVDKIFIIDYKSQKGICNSVSKNPKVKIIQRFGKR